MDLYSGKNHALGTENEKDNELHDGGTWIDCGRHDSSRTTNETAGEARVADDRISDGSINENCRDSICASGGGHAGG